MDKISRDKVLLNKTDLIVREKMPPFANRFFSNMKDSLKAGSLYGYALELRDFFEYLGKEKFDIGRMTLADLNSISKADIEDYVEFSRTYTLNGEVKQRSASALKRRLCAISSFFTYYEKNDLIDRNPVRNIHLPRPRTDFKNIPDTDITLELLDFVENSSLPSARERQFQNILRKRDTALLLLIIGAGIKASECEALDICDIDLKNNVIYVHGRNPYNRVQISPYISSKLGEYLEERLETIAVYGHDDALFLSLRKKRISTRTIEALVQKYGEGYFGKDVRITPMDLRMAFKHNVFTSSRSITATSRLTGISELSLISDYTPYLDMYDSQKGADFTPGHPEQNM